MSRRPLGIVIALVGSVAVLIAVLADPLGIGSVGGFGWKQGVLLAIGIVLAIAGVVMVFRSPSAPESGLRPPPGSS
jgi:hypothetical protein